MGKGRALGADRRGTHCRSRDREGVDGEGEEEEVAAKDDSMRRRRESEDSTSCCRRKSRG